MVKERIVQRQSLRVSVIQREKLFKFCGKNHKTYSTMRKKALNTYLKLDQIHRSSWNSSSYSEHIWAESAFIFINRVSFKAVIAFVMKLLRLGIYFHFHLRFRHNRKLWRPLQEASRKISPNTDDERFYAVDHASLMSVQVESSNCLDSVAEHVRKAQFERACLAWKAFVSSRFS